MFVPFTVPVDVPMAGCEMLTPRSFVLCAGTSGKEEAPCSKSWLLEGEARGRGVPAKLRSLL